MSELLSAIATICTCNARTRKASNGGSHVALTRNTKHSSFSRIQLELEPNYLWSFTCNKNHSKSSHVDLTHSRSLRLEEALASSNDSSKATSAAAIACSSVIVHIKQFSHLYMSYESQSITLHEGHMQFDKPLLHSLTDCSRERQQSRERVGAPHEVHMK